jgi:hypothetical protein
MNPEDPIAKVLSQENFLDLVGIENKLGNLQEKAKKLCYNTPQTRKMMEQMKEKGIDLELARDYAKSMKSKINEIEKKKTLPVILISENKNVKQKKVNPESIEFDIKNIIGCKELKKEQKENFCYFYDPNSKVKNKKASKFIGEKLFGKIVLLANEGKTLALEDIH